MLTTQAAEDLLRDFQVARAFEALLDDPTKEAQVRLIRQIADQIEQSRYVNPQSREVGRIGDMGPPEQTHMRLGLDADGDVWVSVWQGDREALAGIEFCAASGGGGKSPRTRAALIDVMLAMEADNQAAPSGQYPPATTNAASHHE